MAAPHYPEPPSPSDSSLATSLYSDSATPSHTNDSDRGGKKIDRSADYRFSTLAAHVDSKDQYGASSTPIYQTATFKGMDGQYDYTRSGNPTRGGLETHLARLYGAYSTFALSTGMTCLDTILRLVKPGETVLAGDDLYGGTNRLLGYIGTHGGVDVRHLDTTRVEALEPHLGEGNNVKMVLLESPTNPLLKIADLGGIASLVRSRAPSALIVVDNTMMSPYLQRPLDLGCDIVYDSATKYLSGHHDLMAGIIAVKTEEVHKRIAFLINSIGSGLAPFDSFLLLRGVKTISLRMDRQMATAQLVATYLDQLGFLVHYPGLKRHPKRDIHWRQATGAGAVLSFVTDDKALSERIVGGTRLWGISVSFGAVNSLISMPCLMSHASISAAVRAERGLPENLIRLCVGIEDPRDLIDDFEASLLSAGAIVHNLSYSPPPRERVEALFDQDPAAWIIERARAFTRPQEGVMDRLVAGLNRSLGLGLGAGGGERKELEKEVVVSAPGKVILFGEHAVVHGVVSLDLDLDRCEESRYKSVSNPSNASGSSSASNASSASGPSTTSTTNTSSDPSTPNSPSPPFNTQTAIATSVDLRCFAALTPRSDNKVALEAHNLNLEAEWDISALPWKLLPIALAKSTDNAGRRVADKDLDPPLLAAVEKHVREGGWGKTAQGAAVAFLYLYMLIAGDESNAFSATFTASSNLPISAGLGSSAAYSTCAATALAVAHGIIPTPNSSSSAFTPDQINTIDSWAFLAEKVLHGNPSGIDNAVSVRGGAVAFARAIGGRAGELTPIGGFEAVRLLLTNTLVPRDTKTLVAGVTEMRVREPEKVGEVLRRVQGISDEAREVLGGREERGRMIQRLEALIRENHAHLVTLNVSHPSLEAIVAATRRAPFNLATKLTGAGGGGCAVTLIPDEFPESQLDELVRQLRGDGFEPHLTRLGGRGVGILSARAGVDNDKVDEGGEGGAGVPIREGLRRGTEGLGEWVEGLGEWVYA